MKSQFAMAAVVAGLVLIPAGMVQADVKTEERSLVKFEGMLGRVVGIFGGKAAKEGIVSTVAVSGNRKMTVNDYGSELIDLAEEKVYEIDVKKKTYTVTTFAEMRRRMEEAERKAREQAAREQSRPDAEPAQEPNVEIQFSVKETGQRKNINGFDAREVVMTITVVEKGQTLEEHGGMVLTGTSWLAPRIAGVAEVADFDRRYLEKLQGPSMAAAAEQMAAAMAMYPGLKDALARFQSENVNLDGTAIQTIVTFEAVKSKAQMAQQASQPEESSVPTSVGGVVGRFGRRMAQKKQDSSQQSNRATVMTMQHELLKVAPSVAPADVAIPEGFRQK